MKPSTGEPNGPLAGIRVVEMGSLIAGPFCGQMLGDLGADVIKIEAPGAGDPMRGWGRVKDEDGSSLWWPVIGRNKRSVALDLRVEAGQRLARRLILTSDVLIENFRPGTLERWNLGPDRLTEDHPGLVVVRISAFGQTGPYAQRPGYGAIGEAFGGLRYITGDPSAPPARVGISIGDSLCASFATIGTLSALLQRASSGRGQIVDAAIYESVLAMMESVIPEYDRQGYVRERAGSILPGIAPSNTYACKGGDLLLIAANQDTVFARLATVMGREDLIEDPKYESHDARARHQAELDDLIAAWAAAIPAQELEAKLSEAAVPAGRIYRAPEMLSDPHFAAREAIVRIADRTGAKIAMQGVVPKLSRTPGSIRRRAPELGEHSEEVLSEELDLTADELQRLIAQGIVGVFTARPNE